MDVHSSPSDPSRSGGPTRERHRNRWLRIVGWIAGCVALLVVVVIVFVSILLYSPKAHNYLLRLVENKASDALGTRVTLQNFTIHPATLSADVYGIVIDGASPHPTPPLLLVRHAAVGVRIVSILRRKWYLNTVRVDDPVVCVVVDANGVSNLPKPKSSRNSNHIDIFELGIRHAILNRGEIYYNNRKSTLEADVHDLNFRASFDSVLQKYSGDLSYSNGHLQAASFAPIAHNFDVQFDATRDQLQITHAKIESGSSHILFAATLKNYNQPNIRATYDAMFDGGDLRYMLRVASIPTGVVQTSGSITYQYDPKTNFLDAVVLTGNLKSRQLNAKMSNLRAQVNDIAGQYSLANGNVLVRDFRARLFGGRLNATLDIRDIAGASQSKLSATLRGISLAALKRIAPTNTKQLGLGGVVNANAEAFWNKNQNSFGAHADATIRANVSRTGNPANAQSVPVNGELHGRYSSASQQFALDHSFLRTPETTLNLNGTIGNRSGLAVQLESQNIAELETIANLFRTPKAGQSEVEPLDLAGTASFQGVVRGNIHAPKLSGEFTASNLRVKDTQWKLLRADITAGPSGLRVQHGDLEAVSNGRILLTAEVQWSHWSFNEQTPVQLQLQASQIRLRDLEKLTGKEVPVSGILAANIAAHGTVLNPMGHGAVTLTHVEAYRQPIRSVSVTFTGANGELQGNLSAHVAAGAIEGHASVQPAKKTFHAQVTANEIHLDQFEALTARNIDVSGQLQASVNGQGTFDNPQLNAVLKIPQLEIQQQKIQNIGLKMNLANHVANAELTSQAMNTPIEATAKINLTGDYLADATLNTKTIALQPFFAIYGPSQASQLTGETEIHATLHGPLKDRKLLQAQAVLPVLKLGYSNTIQLAAASPIHLVYKNGVVDLARTAIRGTDTDLEIQGSIPIASHASASILLLGTVNLQLAQLFSPDIKSSGQLRFNINSYGARSDPNVEGKVEIVHASFSNADLPLGVQNGNGVLILTRDRLNIQSFQARVGGGTLTAQGGLAYRPSMQFDLGASAKGVRMLYPQGMREEIDADIRLAGTSENALLGGRVRLQNMSFTPDFDLMNFVSQLSSGVAPPPTQGFSQNLRLNLAVSSTNDLNLISRALSIDGTANLQVRGTAAQPVILGRINLNGGDVIFNGNRFTLAGGTVEFVNPSETQPVVNLALNTTIQQYNISLRFNGPVDQLRTNYSSDPSLPAADIINLLAFGQTTEATAANPTPGNQAAMSAVASQVSSQITSRVAKVAGISQLSINPVLAGGSTAGPAGAVVTIQQRVTGNLFVTFSSNVTSSQNQVIMGQYQLSPRVAVSATRDQNGGFGFDTTFKKSW